MEFVKGLCLFKDGKWVLIYVFFVICDCIVCIWDLLFGIFIVFFILDFFVFSCILIDDGD